MHFFNVINFIRNSCLQIERSICIGQNKTEIGIENTPEKLIGHWKFDDKYGIDSSMYQNDVKNTPLVGMQQGGTGYSAHFTGNDITQIQHIDIYNSPEMTLSFWFFIIEEKQGNGWKTILQKGNTSQELTPSIMLWPNQNRLHICVSTDFDWKESLDSISGLLLRRWIHISITVSHQLLQLFINGILDNQKILKGQIRHNKGPFYMGKSPWHQGPNFYMDDLRIYSKILNTKDLQLFSSNTNILFGRNYAQLGCESCTYNQALTCCKENYHLCNFPEMYAGGYQMARLMGWFRLNQYFWVRIEEIDDSRHIEELYDPNVFKLAICCINKGL